MEVPARKQKPHRAGLHDGANETIFFIDRFLDLFISPVPQNIPPVVPDSVGKAFQTLWDFGKPCDFRTLL
jgi:hypothetical protein